MQCTIPNVFQNGTGEINIIDATQVNANFSTIANVLNGNIEKDNIKTGSKICLTDVAMDITAAWTFSANPTFNAGGIADSYLTSNIPKKDTTNTFTLPQTFNAGIDLNKTEAKNFNIELVAGLPTWVSADKGRFVFDTTTNQAYIGSSTAWVRIDYIGGYTGGAICRYSSNGIVDDNDGYKLYFKTEGSTPTVKIAIKGEPFPQRFYTELPYHTHTFTGVAHNHDVTDPTHRHGGYIGSHGHGTTQYGLSNHTHGVSGNVANANLAHTHGAGGLGGSQPTHQHGYLAGDTSLQTSSAGGEAVSIAGNTSGWNIANLHNHSVSLTSGGPSASAAVEAFTIGAFYVDYQATGLTVDTKVAGGTNVNSGVEIGVGLSETQKLYAKSLTVKIDATNITSDILTATGWGAIGDGSGTHAFHTAGTGELDMSGWLTYSPGLHILEIIEPETGFGSSLIIHIESS